MSNDPDYEATQRERRAKRRAAIKTHEQLTQMGEDQVRQAKMEAAKTTLRVNIGEKLMRAGSPYTEASQWATEIVDYFFAKTLPVALGVRSESDQPL